jgi:hypothetical protein
MAASLYEARPDLPFVTSMGMIGAMMIVSVVLLRDPQRVKGTGG